MTPSTVDVYLFTGREFHFQKGDHLTIGYGAQRKTVVDNRERIVFDWAKVCGLFLWHGQIKD
jgi:hypothetical protein